MKVAFGLLMALVMFVFTYYCPAVVGKILFACIMGILVFNMIGKE